MGEEDILPKYFFNGDFMSIDFLQVGKTTTYVRAPDTSIDSANTSVVAAIALGGGFRTTEAGLLSGRFDPAPHFEPFSFSASLSVVPTAVSTFVRVANVAGSTMTNAVMAAGTRDGQICVVVNGSASNIKWAYPAANSRVASATSSSADTAHGVLIPANQASKLVWSEYHSRWFYA